MNFEENQIIGSYRLLKRCGEGAYGQVFIAENLLTQHKIALKIIFGNSSVMERELRGLINYRNCRHENLLEIHHIDKIDGMLYYTMDMADNLNSSMENYLPDTLSNRLTYYKHLPPQVVMLMAKELLAGIKKLHSCGIIHRDIKPDNILWVNGKAVLGDIGLATNNKGNSLIGTPGFMSPALLAGKRSANEADDFFALSRVLYCAASGFTPDRFPQLPSQLSQVPGISEVWKMIMELDKNSISGNPDNILPNGISQREPQKFSTLRIYIISLMIFSLLMILPASFVVILFEPSASLYVFTALLLVFLTTYFWNAVLIKRTFLKILSFFLGSFIVLFSIPGISCANHLSKVQSIQVEPLPDHPEYTVKNVVEDNIRKAKWKDRDDMIIVTGEKTKEPGKGKVISIEFSFNDDGSVNWDHPVKNNELGKTTKEVIYSLASKNPTADRR